MASSYSDVDGGPPPHPSPSAIAAAALATAGYTGPTAAAAAGGSSGGTVGILRTEAGRQQYVQSMKGFWQKQLDIIEKTDFKKLKHQLPLARIKKIMKSDEDVRMISAEAPVLFAKACELFILDLTMRAWAHTDDNKRRTLQRSDIAEAIASSEMFDFLVDIVPREENPNLTEEGGTEQLLRNFQRAPANDGALRRPMENPYGAYAAGSFVPGESSSVAHQLKDMPAPLPAGQSLGIEGVAATPAPTPSALLPSLPTLGGGTAAAAAGGAAVVSEHDRQALAATMAQRRLDTRMAAQTLPFETAHSRTAPPPPR